MYLLEPVPAHRSVSGPIRINTHKNFHIYVLFTSIFCIIESQIGCMTDLIVSVIIENFIFTEIIHFATGYFNLMIIGQ